jgi:hypothetical protein
MPSLCALGHRLHSRTQCKATLARDRVFSRISDLEVVFSEESDSQLETK